MQTFSKTLDTLVAAVDCTCCAENFIDTSRFVRIIDARAQTWRKLSRMTHGSEAKGTERCQQMSKYIPRICSSLKYLLVSALAPVALVQYARKGAEFVPAEGSAIISNL